MFGLSMHELMIIGVIAVLLFGRKLPEVARSLGSSYREFRKGLNDFQSQVSVDNTYTPPTSSYHSRSASYDESAEEPTAPKFEPPPAEPQADAENSSTTSSS